VTGLAPNPYIITGVVRGENHVLPHSWSSPPIPVSSDELIQQYYRQRETTWSRHVTRYSWVSINMANATITEPKAKDMARYSLLRVQRSDRPVMDGLGRTVE
jgi:hypothetical protein